MTTLNKQSLKLTLGITLLIQSIGAMANIDERQIRQGERINQGVQNGKLTQQEANRLNNGQGRIENRKTQFESDGNLNRRERGKLRKMQNNQNRKIFRQKHDRQKV